jgi:transposase
MIGPPSGTRIWLVAGQTDLRKGVDGLSALVQNHLNANPFTGKVYLSRGKSGNKEGVVGDAGKDELSVQAIEQCEVRMAAGT